MKPFDLEAAKAGAPVVARGGRKARIVCFDAENDCPIISLVTDDNGKELIFTHLLNGSFLVDGESSNSDLLMAPIKKEGWINIYSTQDRCLHLTKESAELNAGKERIGCVKVEWEE